MGSTQFSLAIPQEDWDAGSLLNTGGEVAGHEVRVGSILDIQLFMEERHVLRHWTVSQTLREKHGIVDPLHSALATLAVDVQPVRRIIQPLRPQSNLLYFEGIVRGVAKAVSKAVSREQLFHALIDCSVPIVLESRLEPGSPTQIVKSDGDQIIGFGNLWGWLYTPNTLLRSPFRSKVVSIRPVDAEPGAVMLTVVSAPTDATPENKLHYTFKS